jgi:tetratricopeptide (TPR) repeat protein
VADGTPGRKLRFATGACLFVWTCAAYASVVHHEFVNFDDLIQVVHNPNLRRPATLANLLSHFTVPFEGNLLPLHWISLHLGFALHGPDPAAFLITNVLLHAASTVVLFAALRSLTGALWRSAFVAAVFALHPLHVESVAWVAERKDVLAGLFFMLGLYAYSGYARRPSAVRYLAVMLCFALALMSKSSVVSFPAVLLLLDFWPLGRLRGAAGRVLLEKLPLLVLSALASLTTFLTQRAVGNTVLSGPVGWGARLANAVESYWLYLVDVVWPAGLAALYPHPYRLAPISTGQAIAAAGLAAALVAATAVVLAASRRRPYLGVGWLWYLGSLVPMIGLVQVGIQARADRYTYLPLVGLAIMVAWSVPERLSSTRRRLLAGLAGGVLVAFTVVTRLQLRHWQDSFALYERAIAVTERNFYAHERLAYELLHAGRPAAARDHYRAAIAIAPSRAPLYYGLALSLSELGDREAAIATYRIALKREPNMVLAHGSLGLLLLEAGRLAEARQHLSVAAHAMPDSAEYRDALEEVESRLGLSSRQ